MLFYCRKIRLTLALPVRNELDLRPKFWRFRFADVTGGVLFECLAVGELVLPYGDRVWR